MKTSIESVDTAIRRINDECLIRKCLLKIKEIFFFPFN
jgi:hypothetical protein